MKALTLTQPYATLIAIGAKRIETRSWATSYRGPLAIHAGKGLGPVGGISGLRDLCHDDDYFYPVLRDRLTSIQGSPIRPIDALPLGAIIATCDLVDCCLISESVTAFTLHNARQIKGVWKLTEQERAFGDYTPGRYAWLLDNVRALPEPIPAKGALSLWEWQMPEGIAPCAS